MTAWPSFRTWQTALSVVALALVGLTILATRDTGLTAAQPVVEAPACSSCDARHARLSGLRAKQSEGLE
jgi:hypothetical protein